MVWGKCPTSSLSMWILLSQHHLLKTLFSPHWMVWGTIVRINWPQIYTSFWTLNSIPLICMSIPYANTTLTNVTSCKVWNKKVRVFQLPLLFSRLFWLFRVPCSFIMNFGLTFPFLQKGHCDFERYCMESADCFGKYQNIKSSNTGVQYLFPFT